MVIRSLFLSVFNVGIMLSYDSTMIMINDTNRDFKKVYERIFLFRELTEMTAECFIR